MSYHEKRSLVYLLSSILITAVYFGLAAQRYPQTGAYSPEVFRFWGTAVLVLIPVSIVLRIVTHITFSIFNTLATQEEEPAVTDERDQLIALKGSRNALYVFSAGFLAAMLALVLHQPPAVMFALLTAGGLLSEIVSELSSLLYYRRGF